MTIKVRKCVFDGSLNVVIYISEQCLLDRMTIIIVVIDQMPLMTDTNATSICNPTH